LRGAFVFDPNRCTGCQACELACSIENQLGPERSWRSVLTFNERSLPGVPVFHLSLACNHCEEPACMHSCPALAYERDVVTGAVLIRTELCIGCKYCSWACPYGAPRFEPDNGVMGKCTFCSHRLADGLAPACAALCPTGALDYAELPVELLTAELEGFPQTDLGPSIRILPRTGRTGQPEDPPTVSGSFEPGTEMPNEMREEPSIGLSSEWSLAGFTFLLALLFALLSAGVVGTLRIPALVYATISGIAAMLSLTHLGRPTRAWRAILNLRRSPVSREVLGFGALGALGTLSLALPAGEVATGAGWLGLGAGLLALVSADGVYRPVFQGGRPALHSGGTLFTGLYLAGLFSGIGWLAAPVGAFKLYRYVARRTLQTSRLSLAAGGWTGPAARLGLGLLVPGLAWAWTGIPLPAWALGAALVGEAEDRAEFYSGLEIISPARQLRQDLEARLADYEAGPAIRSMASASSS
jgi:Fe-S-cluster-containing dehydrogenase component